MDATETITTSIAKYPHLSPLLPQRYLQTPAYRFDFSRSNSGLAAIDMMHSESLQSYVASTLHEAGRTWGFGGYGEDRFFYQSSPLFKKGDEYRTVHLGIDIWLPPGTVIFSPLPATVVSVQDNAHFLDYGPTVILEHCLGDTRFFSLYGHQGRASVAHLRPGQKLYAGETLSAVGESSENGSWAPHLHLQLMNDLLGNSGDFPGVATPSEKDFYLRHCPNPEILLASFLAG